MGRTNLWANVEEIILQHYDSFKSTQDPSKLVRLRKSYYIVREHLNERLEEGKITQKEYDYYAINPQAYATYRDDLWPSLEQQRGLERPEAKEVGVIYTQEDALPLDKFDEIYYRVRGFIFVEKADEAEDLKPLSSHGWAIIAGQGFSTRLIRHLFKEDGRPVLALHDCDKAGEDIYRVFGEGSRRTRHLDLLIERVTDLGLKEEDALKLSLQSQPEALKFRKERKERYELSALNVLKVRYGIENPVLAYAVAKMRIEGVRISPTSEEIPLLMKWEVESEVERVFRDLASSIQELADFPIKLAEEMNNTLEYPEGEAVDVDIPNISEISFDLSVPLEKLRSLLESEIERIKPELVARIENSIQEATIIDEEKYEQAVIEQLGNARISEILGVGA